MTTYRAAPATDGTRPRAMLGRDRRRVVLRVNLRGSWCARTIAFAAVATIAVGACGGDDDSNADATATTSAADAHPTSFCGAFDDVNQALAGVENDRSDDPTTAVNTAKAALDAADEAAPSPIKDAVATMTATGRDQIGGSADQDDHSGPPLPPAEFFTASAEVGAWVAGNCKFGEMHVAATENAFSGVPATAPAGPTLIRLTNNGAEYHEIVLFRVAAGEMRSAQALVALPEDQFAAALQQAGGSTLAAPGTEGVNSVDLAAGRYVAACFIPVGSTPAAFAGGQIDPNAPTHAVQGMVAEFQVS